MRGDDLVERLPCRLTAREKEQRAEDLARTVKQLEDLRAEKASLTRAMAEEIKDAEKTMAELSEQVRTGVERRKVELGERPDYARGVVEIFRMDTGETLRTRAIEPAERQQALFAEAEAEARRRVDGGEDEAPAH